MELVQLYYVSSINLKDIHLVAKFKQVMHRAMTVLPMLPSIASFF